MLVSRVQGQIVLQYERRQPHVVGRNRCALFPELAKERRIVVGRLVVGEEHAHAVSANRTTGDPCVAPGRFANLDALAYSEGRTAF